MNDDAYKAIYNKALDIISRREHSKKELTDKLAKKYDIPELVDSVIYGLLEKNLLNDYRYSESYVVARQRKGFGPTKIGYELISRGVNESTASEVIDAEGGWNEAALKAFNKNLAALSEDMTFKDAKTELQELFQSLKSDLPKYIIEDIGKNKFLCTVKYKDMVFESSGTSKRIAETNVAMKLLAYIKQNDV